MPTKITSLKQLKAEAEQGAEFFILLNHRLRSSKVIAWDAAAKRFHVFNHIDQTEHLTERQVMARGNTLCGAPHNKKYLKYSYDPESFLIPCWVRGTSLSLPERLRVPIHIASLAAAVKSKGFEMLHGAIIVERS